MYEALLEQVSSLVDEAEGLLDQINYDLLVAEDLFYNVDCDLDELIWEILEATGLV